MRAGWRRMVISAAIALSVLWFDASAALAQLVQSDVDAQPGSTQTTQLVTSSTEVRRAVVGLLAVAVVVAILGILYWRQTGTLARERYAHRYGGRHNSEAGATAVAASAPTPSTAPGPSRATRPAQPVQAVPVGAAGIADYGSWSTASAGVPLGQWAHTGYAGSSAPLSSTPARQTAPVWNPRPQAVHRSSPAVPPTPRADSPRTAAPRPQQTPRRSQAPRPQSTEVQADRGRGPRSTTAASPYPDLDPAGPERRDGGRWSSLRRDLFG